MSFSGEKISEEIRSRLERLRIKLPVGLIIAEEMAREIAESLPRPREIVTKVVDLKDKTITFEYDIFESKTRGKLQELVIHSPSRNFRVVFALDGRTVLDKTYDELEAISPYLDTVSAFEENGKYIIHLKDFNWLEFAWALVRVKEKITFFNIFCKWDEFL